MFDKYIHDSCQALSEIIGTEWKGLTGTEGYLKRLRETEGDWKGAT